MSYDPAAANLGLLKRTIFGFSDFHGRSSRTEVLCYWIASIFAGILLSFPVMILLPSRLSFVAIALYQFVALIPTFALFARRLHDQDRSAWWMLLYVGAVGHGLVIRIMMATGAIDPLSPAQIYPNYFTIILTIALLILWFLPGTNGDNSYGPDPREGG